jgi:hypothetical protein
LSDPAFSFEKDFEMTLKRNWLGSNLMMVIALGAMSAPALAQGYGDQPSGDRETQRETQNDEFRTPSGKKCAIGETNNGGSISSSTVDDDSRRDSPDPRSCDDVGQH